MKNILVIDDDQLILNMICRVLNREGIYTETALDGIEGLRKFSSGAYDLVITDIDMPKATGNAVAEDIRKSVQSETPIIAITGKPRQLKTEFFDAVVHKPFSLSALMEEVQKFLSNNSAG